MAYADFQLSNQVCPIVLVGGIAGTGVLPIATILQSGFSSDSATASSAADGATSPAGPAGNRSPYGSFGSFRVLPGGTLIDNDVATYPLATMAVAANAVISNELRFAVEMITPASADVTLSQRLSIFTTLKNTLNNHIAAGGYFNVATPALIYTGCLLTSLVDASDVPDGAQTQTRWVWNFEQPLITLQAATQAVNNAMNKVSGQTYNAGQPPGSQPLRTSVSNPSIGQQVTPNSSNAAAVTQTVPIAPSGANGTGNYV